MKKVLKLINNETIFGEVSAVQDSPDIFIENPWQALNGKIMPYMMNDLKSPLKALQIHPMNIVWSAPLDDFKEIYNIYSEKTSGIIL